MVRKALGEDTVSVTLTMHEIGRASDPTATTRSRHPDMESAYGLLCALFGPDSIRGDRRSGTIGSLNGRVFQASRIWSIRED